MLLFINTHKKVLSATVAVALIFAFDQAVPFMSQGAAFAMFWFVGFFDNWLGWIIALGVISILWCALFAAFFWLAAVKNYILVAAGGYALSHYVMSILGANASAPIALFIISFTVGLALFLLSALVVGRLRIPIGVAVALALLILLVEAPASMYAKNFVQDNQYELQTASEFENARNSLAFKAYAPTYQSAIFSASIPLLHGYSKDDAYSVPTVTFLLGNARVKEGTFVKHQAQIMNFTNNCDIPGIWFSLSKGEVDDYNLRQSLDNYTKCELLHTTQSGKKVYFHESGQWTWFYVLLGKTNIVIEFDSGNRKDYDPNQLPELLKVIDSLEPFDNKKLEKGNPLGPVF